MLGFVVGIDTDAILTEMSFGVIKFNKRLFSLKDSRKHCKGIPFCKNVQEMIWRLRRLRRIWRVYEVRDKRSVEEM